MNVITVLMVQMTVVYVIYVSIVLDGLMTITGQMFMIWGGMTIGHTCSFGRSVFPGRHQSGPLSTPSPNHLGGFGRISTEHVLRFRK